MTVDPTGELPHGLIIAERILPMRTAYKWDSDMQRLFGALAMKNITRCLLCDSPHIAAHGVWIPDDGHAYQHVDEEGVSKDIVFG